MFYDINATLKTKQKKKYITVELLENVTSYWSLAKNNAKIGFTQKYRVTLGLLNPVSWGTLWRGIRNAWPTGNLNRLEGCINTGSRQSIKIDSNQVIFMDW